MAQLSGISHVYVTEHKAVLAVDNLSLLIKNGEFVSIIGPSGCGKTTLLTILSGLVRPTSGEVRIQGNKLEAPNPQVGFMFQQDYLFPWKTIEQNARLGLEVTGLINKESLKYVEHLLDEMELLPYRNARPQHISIGLRQRAALVRTLATKPEFILLDEPFSGLDYQTKLQLEDIVVETLKTQKKTVLLVTHDISEAIAMSDRIIVLSRHPGRVRRTFVVPDSIRAAVPFQAREQQGFNSLFQQVWRELEAADTGR